MGGESGAKPEKTEKNLVFAGIKRGGNGENEGGLLGFAARSEVAFARGGVVSARGGVVMARREVGTGRRFVEKRPGVFHVLSRRGRF